MRKGDRVLLLMQNSPQFVIGYYGILRANAVVVPLNPMNLTQEIAALRRGLPARTRVHRVAGALSAGRAAAAQRRACKSVIVAAYSDYLKQPTRSGGAGLHRRTALADRQARE